MNKYLIILIIALCSIFAIETRAEDNGNGVDVVNSDIEELHLASATWYTNFDPSSTTYIYNESGEATVTSGAFDDAFFILDGGTLTVFLSTLNSTSITFRVEGQNKFGNNWSEVFSKTYTSAMTIGETFPITTYFDNIRVGLIVVGDAADDDISITVDFLTKERISH